MEYLTWKYGPCITCMISASRTRLAACRTAETLEMAACEQKQKVKLTEGAKSVACTRLTKTQFLKPLGVSSS